MNGHKLEDLLCDAFPALRKHAPPAQPNSLKTAIVDLVYRDAPFLVPAAIVTTFRSIQAATRV
jgi:hypothetical protein